MCLKILSSIVFFLHLFSLVVVTLTQGYLEDIIEAVGNPNKNTGRVFIFIFLVKRVLVEFVVVFRRKVVALFHFQITWFSVLVGEKGLASSGGKRASC